MSIELSTREAVGAEYSLAAIRAAQARSWQALHSIAAEIRPRMTEAEAVQIGKRLLTESGMELAWHPLLVRFGAETLKVFADRSTGEAVLGADDIFFIDMGPVYGGHEADAGASFTVGNDAEMQACARDVKVIFDRAKAIWGGGAVTGEALYDAVAAETAALGWALNLDIKGHRVGDYPHAAGGKLGELAAVPGTGLWILEVQIRHPTRPFGAFYEDLLA